MTFSPRFVGGGGGGRRRLGGTWVLGTSFNVDPLFLFASNPFKPDLDFKSVLLLQFLS